MSRGFQPLADLKNADLPAKKLPNWKLAGPGAVLVGLSIGAGEIIIWPRIAAEFGAGMVWAAVFGVFLQMWINFEVGRWTIATGETIYTGFARAWRGFAAVFILLNIFAWLAPGWAQASGLALKALLVGPHWHLDPTTLAPIDFWGTKTFWTIVTFVGVTAVLFGPKIVYRSVEHTIEVLILIVVIGLISVAFLVGTGDTWVELGKGIVNIGHRDPKLGVKEFFIALVFAGAGGTANLFYSFYLRDKHIGMGGRVPSMQNPLRGRSEKIPTTGFIFPDNDINRSRFRSWWGFVRMDQALYFWLLNSLTMLLFIFGALAVLHPQGIVPDKDRLIYDQAVVIGSTQVWGKAGMIIFLLVGVATLFSTQLALIDGVGRSIADMIYTNINAAQKRDVSWWYLLVVGIWIVAGCAITAIMEKAGVTNLGFLFNAAYMGGFAMAIYVPLTFYINWRYLPKAARPGLVCSFMMFVATCVYVGFAFACIVWEIKRFVAD